VATPDEELGGAPPETAAQEPTPPGTVDWAKVSESFDRHQGVGRPPVPGGAARQGGFDQARRIDLDAPAESAPKPENGTEPRELREPTSTGPSLVRTPPAGTPATPAPAAVPQAQPARPAPAGPKPAAEEPALELLERAEVDGFRDRWPEIKAVFVDDPRASVEQADALVNEVTELVVRRLTEERSRLESEWGRGEVSTEDLRQSLHRYQVFFDHITAV
jgi:hypothetical protein